jgi:hypothetical protein
MSWKRAAKIAVAPALAGAVLIALGIWVGPWGYVVGTALWTAWIFKILIVSDRKRRAERTDRP